MLKTTPKTNQRETRQTQSKINHFESYFYSQSVVAMAIIIVMVTVVKVIFPRFLQSICGDQVPFSCKDSFHLTFAMKGIFKVEKL